MSHTIFKHYEPDKKGSMRTAAEDVVTPLKHLFLSPAQRDAINKAYNGKPSFFAREFRVNAPGEAPHPDQLVASALLASYELDQDSVDDLAHPWNSRWKDTWGSKQEKRKRILFQCACGYYSPARGSRKDGQGGIKEEDRKCGYDHTGCLAHADVVFRECDRALLRISGFLSHNPECVDAKLVRRPAIPLHPHVYEVALAQLAEGADCSGAQHSHDRLCFVPRLCRVQPQDLQPSLRHHSDRQTLYRMHYRAIGIDWAKSPELNIDDWLDKQSDAFKSELASAITGYHPRTKDHDRFQLIIQTEEMKKAAWDYGHWKQIIMDATFGFTSSKILVFIIMAIDDEGHGVPLTFMLFSPPPQNRATQAGYDARILTELLSTWVASLGLNNDGETFCPKLAITDTDSKERGALNAVFPGIVLRLCRFHILQCWKNHLKKFLKAPTAGKGGGRRKTSAIEREAVRKRVKLLQQSILTAPTLVAAQAHVSTLRADLQRQASAKTAYSAASSSAIHHLDYLSNQWLKPGMWDSLSDAGRVAAAAKLGIPVADVANTSNHLESLNGLLKNKHLARYKRGGCRIRLDFLIWLLVRKILPSILGERRKQRRNRENADSRFFEAAGNVALGSQRARLAPSERVGAAAWLAPDSEAAACERDKTVNQRELGAISLLQRGFVLEPSFPSASWAHAVVDVISSTSIPTPTGQRWATRPTIYSVHIRPLSVSPASPSLTFATCPCADFSHRGGTCIHIRAALIRLRAYPDCPVLPPLPSSARAGRVLGDLVTSPPQTTSSPPSPPPTTSQVELASPVLVRTLVGALAAFEDESDSDSGSSSDDDSDAGEDGEASAPVVFVPFIPPTSAAATNHAAILHQTQARLSDAAEKARMALLTCIELAREAPDELDLSTLGAKML